ncbi:MAG TPA: HlyD family efflux transporter periplasmic adaptor subunit [Bryobacterales bacterium]|nr:HlyD family efflux transporter periplasmic adaptor subunit [Bryobacterales bacterium]
MRKLLVRLSVLLVVLAVAGAAYYFVSRIPDDEPEQALAEVKRGELVVKTYLRGALQAVRSTTLTAPNLGSASQVTQLAASGSLAKPNDLIAEFDDSDRRVFLEDAMLDVEKTKQNLKKGEVELQILRSKDEVELMSARFGVRRAELDVRQNELISKIDARKNELTLEEAKRRLQKLESDIQSRLQQREAELAVLREEIRKAELDVARDRRRIEDARVLTPLGGLVSILENRSGRRSFGQASPPVQEGDEVSPGMALAQILDLSEMELVAQAEEVERTRLREGQEAIVYLDALPGKPVKATIKRLGSTASADFFSGQATKKFDCVLSVDMTQLLTSVGATPEQIRTILASGQPREGAAKRSRPPSPAPGVVGANAGAPSGPAAVSGKTEKSARGARSPEERERAQKMMQELAGGRDVESMSQEERRKLFQQMRSRMGGGRAAPADKTASGPQDGPGQPGAPIEMPPLPVAIPNSPFTAAQRLSAKLPEPPQQGSVVEVLLRPGLLADAEVVVERIPDTLHIPVQAVYPSGENNIVYVWDGNDLEVRRVEVGQRTETRVAVLSGLEEGETVSLQPPPDQRQTTKKKKSGKKSGPSLPGGAAGGGEGGGPGGGSRRQR